MRQLKKLIAVWGMAALFGALMACTLTPQADRTARTVAITFDDLPMPNPDQEAQPLAAATDINDRILASLRKARAPATGFANEKQIRTIGPGAEQLLNGWNRGKFELGNHGATHADANALDLAQLEREIIDGESTIGPLVRKAGGKLKFFRFPFNHLGETAEKQAGTLALLQTHGYELAASTIDTSDYIFSAAFMRAVREGDSNMQTKIKQAYLDHTSTQIAYYAGLNQQVLGYEAARDPVTACQSPERGDDGRATRAVPSGGLSFRVARRSAV